MGLDELGGEAGVKQGGRPNRHPCRARREGRRHALGGAKAARELHPNVLPHRAGDLCHKAAVDRAPLPGAVQVDNVNPACPHRRELLCRLDRVARIGRLSGEVAAGEADHPPAPEVDRGYDVEACAPRATVIAY